ncbi:MAG TPA: hypothetical protein VGF67_28955 [Ktedonobacteraceae bacterium]|jgi:hypothetical protein
MTNQPEKQTRPKLHPPQAAAIAGIVFALLLSASLVLLRLASPNESGVWTAGRAWSLGLNLVPFSGLAFLWFLGVLRDRIGEDEDRFFTTISIGSGLLFLAMLFTAAAVASGLATSAGTVSPALIAFGRQIASTILNVYAMRMAAMCMFSTSTIFLRTTVLPAWLAYTGYAFAAAQLIMLTHWEWIMLLFPLWVLLLSSVILVSNRRASSRRD